MNRTVQELKKAFSAQIREIPGVSGIGIAGGKLTIYLVQDLPGVEQKVRELLRDEAHADDLQFEVSGAFRASG